MSLKLTEREAQVVRLLATGITARETGKKLGISKRTVETHKNNAMFKLDAKNVAHLIAIAQKQGIIEP